MDDGQQVLVPGKSAPSLILSASDGADLQDSRRLVSSVTVRLWRQRGHYQNRWA